MPTPNLKRPGSPNLSDASGTETSSRKKAKKIHNGTKFPSSQPHLLPPSSSAPDGQRKPSVPIKRTHSTAGSGSDNEAGSGAEMSEGGTRKTIKLRMGSAVNRSGGPESTPRGSRAASPARAPLHPHPKAASPPPEGLPTQEQIREKIPATGISVKELLDVFSLSKGEKDHFSKLLRKVSVYDKETRLLKPMPG